jgi:MoxR-like ATPase
MRNYQKHIASLPGISVKDARQKYAGVKNAQDLLDMGVIPKDARNSLATLAYMRLVHVAKAIGSQLDINVLGQYVSPFAEVQKKTVTGDYKKYASVDDDVTFIIGEVGYHGIIKEKNKSSVQVELDSESLAKYQQMSQTSDTTVQVNYDAFIQLDKKVPVTEKVWRETVQADKDFGHRFTLDKEVKGYYTNASGSDTLPKGLTGKLVGRDNDVVTIQIDTDKKVSGNRTNYRISIEDATSALKVSTLGIEDPQDYEQTLREETLNAAFQTTQLDSTTTQNILEHILCHTSLCLNGPPGTGKTQLLKDLVQLFSQQHVGFAVKGSQIGDNPFSTLEHPYAQKVQASPVTLAQLDADNDFLHTGIYDAPKPKDVSVQVHAVHDGHNVAELSGDAGVRIGSLKGHKMPQIRDGQVIENHADPNGFQPGPIIGSNTFIGIDEVDKLTSHTTTALLGPINDRKVRVEGQRYSWPSDLAWLFTSNSVANLTGPFNDRVAYIHFQRPTDPEQMRRIMDAAFYGKKTAVEKLDLPDIHTVESLNLRKILMPAIIENTLGRLYIDFNQTYTGPAKNDQAGSTRSMIDALRLSRAKLAIDQIFFSDAPNIATAEYMLSGFHRAVESRIEKDNPADLTEAQKSLHDWSQPKLETLLSEETNKWWCDVKKQIAIAKTQIPQIEVNFNAEIETYKQNPNTAVDSFNAIKSARDDQTQDRMQAAQNRIQYPFMDFLFDEQKGQHDIRLGDDVAITELVSFYVTRYNENLQCPVPTKP